MISEQEALNALKTWNDRGEDYVFASLVVAEWARQELARRDWQDEPSGEGWYWLEQVHKRRGPTWVYLRDGKWYFDGDFRKYPVTGRVCKITERPA